MSVCYRQYNFIKTITSKKLKNMFKNKLEYLVPILLMGVFVLSGCEAIGSIFKAGVWTGIIGVILVVILVIYLAAKLFSGKKD